MRAISFLCIALLFSPSLWAFDAFRELGAGPRSKGMGGVGIAYPQDSLVSAHNPAGMSLLCRRFDAGGSWVRLSGSAHLSRLVDETHETFKSTANFGYPEAGILWPIEPCTTLGLATYLYGAFDAAYDGAIPGLGTSEARSLYRQQFLTPSVAYLISPCMSVGIALNIAIGTAQFDGLQGLIPLSEHSDRVTNQGKETALGASVRIGWLGYFCQSFSLGVVYQTRTWMAKFKKYKGLIPDEGNLDLPSLFGLGFTSYFSQNFVISLDLEYLFWSDVEFFGNRADSLNPFGSKSGPGLGWADGLTLKLGAAYSPYKNFTLRVGYNYGRAPTDNNNTMTNILTLLTAEHHITFGSTLRFCRNALSFAFLYGFPQNHSGPLTREEKGDFIRLKGRQLELSFAYGRLF